MAITGINVTVTYTVTEYASITRLLIGRLAFPFPGQGREANAEKERESRAGILSLLPLRNRCYVIDCRRIRPS